MVDRIGEPGLWEAEVEEHRRWLAGRGAPLVLVVEDEEGARTALSELLRMCGYRVAAAERTEEAVRMARELRPAAVLMDLMLPDDNGIDAAALLGAHPDTAGIPVVALTGSWLGERPEVLAAEGFAGALRKPCDGPLLLAELERVLALPPGGGRAAVSAA